MKIAAILEISHTAGGGFNQAMSAVLQMARLCEGHYEFSVYTSSSEGVNYLSRLGVEANLYRISLFDHCLAYAATNQLLRRMQSKLRWIGGLEKRLLSDKVDVVYFVTPSFRCLSLQKLNYITTIWDLCHLDAPEFPEVRAFNEFLLREHKYSHSLSQALWVLCDSAELADRASDRYGLDRDRLLSMPFSPAPFAEEPLASEKDEVLNRYELEDGYYFYPAQFWAHKNHIRILQALKLLSSQGVDRHVVFCGGDGGNLSHVESVAEALGLESMVHFLGFVPVEDIRGLYEGACAVVVPSYFGPTNLPPLEAWLIGVPLIYSSSFPAMVGDAAILADPDSAEEWADAMRKIIRPETADSLRDRGRQRLREIEQERLAAEREMSRRLAIFSKRLECWKC